MTIPVKFDYDSALYRALIVGKLRLDMACFPTEAVDEFFEEKFELDYEAKKGKEKNESKKKIFVQTFYLEMGGTYDYFDNKDRWQFLSKEVQQKQELIHRAMKEINDKSDDLKSKGNEILELRSSIKQLKLENFKLHQKLEGEEEVERRVEMTKDIAGMSATEVKNKLLKLAQAYKTERLRNLEFEGAIKRSYKDLDTIGLLEAELETLSLDHAEKSQKLLLLQKETAKESIFQETVKKQESVIARLENLLEKSVLSKEKARENSIELESMKEEVARLQNQVKQASFGP